MSEDTYLLEKGATTAFLNPGQLWMFYPQEYFSRLTLCRTRSTDAPAVHIKKRAALAVLERMGTWRYVICSGFTGWINVADNQAQSKVFVRTPTIQRYMDWKGTNIFLFGGRVIMGSDGKLFLFTNIMAVLVTYLFFWHLAPKAPHSRIFMVGTSLLPHHDPL
jgi:hypothetical protein